MPPLEEQSTSVPQTSLSAREPALQLQVTPAQRSCGHGGRSLPVAGWCMRKLAAIS